MHPFLSQKDFPKRAVAIGVTTLAALLWMLLFATVAI